MITQELLHKILNYDQYAGIFTWKKGRQRISVGDVAGSLKKSGYVDIWIDQKQYRAHRLAWLYTYGYLPEHEIDHKNRIKDNNWISNLRESTRLCNVRNIGISIRNKSGVIGVHFGKGLRPWKSQIGVNRKIIHIGGFPEFSEAAKARWQSEKKHNFPNCNTTSSAYQWLKSNGMIDE